jgi:hypothetical protein
VCVCVCVCARVCVCVRACVRERDLETSKIRQSRPELGYGATEKETQREFDSMIIYGRVQDLTRIVNLHWLYVNLITQD